MSEQQGKPIIKREHATMAEIGATHWGNPAGLTFDPSCLRCWGDANAALRGELEMAELALLNYKNGLGEVARERDLLSNQLEASTDYARALEAGQVTLFKRIEDLEEGIATAQASNRAIANLTRFEAKRVDAQGPPMESPVGKSTP